MSKLTSSTFMLIAVLLLGLTLPVMAQARDRIKPVASLTAPAAGTTFTSAGTISITASATDNYGIKKVAFYDGTVLKATDTAAPYSYAWTVSAADNGAHSLTAKAYDISGNIATSSPVNVTVNIPAAVAQPGAFQFAAASQAVNEGGGKVNITINRVGGSDGIATIAWKTQGVTATFAQDYGNFDWTTLTFAAGETSQTHSISIVDDTLVEGNETFNVLLSSPTGATLGTISTTVVTILDNEDLTAPTVAITSPASGTVLSSAQTLAITASAADNIGVTKVELYDANTLLATDSVAPYSFAWTISSANNGSHSLTAKAYDAAGNSALSSATAMTVNIAVADPTAPTVAITSPASGTSLTSAQTLTITANASDNVGVTKVEFYDGVTLLASDSIAPYSFAWSISSANNGSHSLTAKAYDAAGNSSTTSATAVTVNIAAAAAGPLKAFPGAEGFGTTTPAGRGGQIIKVTNLNDSGTGSLRAAITASGPRIIVFEVGGKIKLASDITVSQPFVTIAGQTAPFPGIEISGGRITIQTHDVLLQHLRARYGDYSGTNASHAMRIISGSYNVVVDHCTFMWADDEVASIWTNSQPIHDITFSNNIVAEGLAGHGYGTIVGAFYSPSPGPNWVDKVSLVKNLYAHNHERSPSLSRDVNAVVINNLSYNAQWEFMALGLNNGPTKASIIGNHCITGASNYGGAAIGVAPTGVGSRIYQTDNKVSGVYSRTVFSDGTGNSVVSQPPLADDTTILPVASVKDYVLRNVGAWPAYRDAAEIRVIDEVRNGTGFHKNSIADAGGWPTEYNTPTNRSFASFIPANPNGDDDGDGYSNIEEVLSQLAAQVEGR